MDPFHSRRPQQGTIEVIAGCMSSGKSEELIRRVRRAVIARLGVIVIKPMHDTRTDAVTVASRDGATYQAVAVERSVDMLKVVQPEHQVVGIEEAQFFDVNVVSIVNVLVAQRARRVIIAGLDTDYRGRPFGMMGQLMAVADSVTKVAAVCMRCGNAAVRTQILFTPSSADTGSAEFVGGDDKYEARCRDCHVVPS